MLDLLFLTFSSGKLLLGSVDGRWHFSLFSMVDGENGWRKRIVTMWLFSLYRMAEWVKQQAEREADKEQRRLERLKRKLTEPKHFFTNPDYQQQCHEMAERLEDSVLKGNTENLTLLWVWKQMFVALHFLVVGLFSRILLRGHYWDGPGLLVEPCPTHTHCVCNLSDTSQWLICCQSNFDCRYVSDLSACLLW